VTLPVVLAGRLRSWRLQRFASLWAEGLLRVAAVLAAYFLGVLLADALFALPKDARLAFFAAGAAWTAYAAYSHLLRPLRLLAAPRLLRDVGGRYPQTRPFLHSAWELAAAGHAPNTSRELALEHVARAERLAAGLPRESAFPVRPSLPALKRFAAVAALWVLIFPWLPQGASGMSRVLSPWRDSNLDSAVSVLPGDRKLAWAEPASIQARWLPGRAEAGGPPLSLWLRSDGSGWTRVPWDQEDEGGGVYQVAGVRSVLDYRVGHRGLRTRAYRLTPLPYPHFRSVVARVRLPGKAQAVAERPLGEGAELAALRGSWVTLRGRPDAELRSATLRLSSLGQPVEMRALPSGEWEGGFPLNDDGTLKLDLVCAEGSRDPDPVAYGVRALQDEPPVVELLSPAFELEVSPKEKLPVAYLAKDDYGLTELSLLYRAGGEEHPIALTRPSGAREEILGDYLWDLSRFKIGERVEFRLKARDNAWPAPQSAVSNKGVLHLVDFESAHAVVERKRLEVEAELGRLAGQERRVARSLADVPEKGPDPETLAKLLEEDRSLAGTWERAVSRMEELTNISRDDPYANPGADELNSALTQVMQGLMETELRPARSAVSAREWPAASRRHEALEAKVRQVYDLFTAGREMQATQDFWAEAHRMDQAGSEIRSALDRIAQAGKPPSAEELRELQQALDTLRGQMDSLAKAIEGLPKAEPGSTREMSRKVYVVPLGAARRTADALAQALARGDYAAAARIARRLSEELERARQALAEAAKMQAGAEAAAPKALEEALKLWEDVVAQQSEGLQMTSRIEDVRMKERLQAQGALLEDLAREQNEVLRDAAALGSPMPQEALRDMKQVLSEFTAARVQEAPTLLQRIAFRLRAQVINYPPLKEGLPREGRILTGLAEREESILKRLEGGVPESAPTEAQLSEMFAAGAMQGQARRKTADLEERLRAVSRDFGMMPPDVIESVKEAQIEQRAAEGALGKRDTGAARKHQERALELLDQGQKSCSNAMQRQQSMSQGMTQPFSRPRGMVRPYGKGGQAGADIDFVPLPGADDYQPPKEIRREVEKSLREKRPKAFDKPVEEYLRRMSQ